MLTPRRSAQLGLLAACSVLICCFGILLGRNFESVTGGHEKDKAPVEIKVKVSDTVAQR